MKKSEGFYKNLNPFYSDEEPRTYTFAVCDIEVEKWVNFLSIGYFNGRQFNWWGNPIPKKEITNIEAYEKPRLGHDLTDFFEYLADQDDVPDIIFAHFGGIFDFTYLIREILRKKSSRYKFTLKDMIPRGSGVLCFTVKVDDEKGNTVKELKFSDSSALLPFGLAKLCKSFGVEHKKLQIDYTTLTKNTEKLIKYLEHDCRGLWEVLQKFSEWELVKKSGMALTMAGQAIKVLRLFLPEPVRYLPKGHDEFVRKAYVGGRTEIFKPVFGPKLPVEFKKWNDSKKEKWFEKEMASREKSGKLLKLFDVNSLYPYVMLANSFPISHLGWTYEYDPSKPGFYDATVEVPEDMYVPPLPLVQEQKDGSTKLVFPTGRFSGRWSTVELEYARSVGVKIIKTGYGLKFEDPVPIFKEFIETLYKMRLEAQAKGDGVGDILTKLLMNSCYGRFGLNLDKEEITIDQFFQGSKIWSEIDVDGEIWQFSKNPKRLNKAFSNVAVAAWVTSCARIHMHKLYMKCETELYYTDTDSLQTTKDFPTGKELGALKLEKTDPLAIFLLPKTYITQGSKKQHKGKNEKGEEIETNRKVVMKGFDAKKIGKFGYEDFYCALEGDMRLLKVKNDEKFATFKTSVRKGKLVQLLPESTKQIRSQYTKRTVFKNERGEYDTRAIVIRG